jgi:glycosyltransferase involved in cell wall biosynthesis
MQLRAHYQISADEIVLLFVGKLVSWKRPQDLLEALKRSQQILGAEVKLLAFFAGDGAMRNKLVAQARTKNLRAIFAGFINVDILPNIYAMADVLVFPSEKEPYGLSAREAICVGLPLIVSDQIGCIGSNDAARPEQNALVYPSMNGVALSDAIVDLVSNPVNMQNMATASLAIAHEMISEQSVAGFIDAVKSVHYRR